MLKTEKKKLLPIEEENKLLELEGLYYQTPKEELVPDKLYHFIREEKKRYKKEAFAKIKKEGLINAKNPRGTTSFIDQKVKRPLGIYFWGEMIKEETHIEVKINKLDLTKLYAFPHQIADEILKLNEEYQISNHFWERLKDIAITIPFEEYQGQFKAEFIYTKDIPSKNLNIKRR
ncbi:hypothetical protein [Halonatronum saccharophilum]|uniref:hypothetical protein n=1 Tax=Halonatronum saccharophilum TaxID=150060 RepID=UPI00048100B4|nr:hypothetical protein [Halonatronum saccharophilum]